MATPPLATPGQGSKRSEGPLDLSQPHECSWTAPFPTLHGAGTGLASIPAACLTSQRMVARGLFSQPSSNFFKTPPEVGTGCTFLHVAAAFAWFCFGKDIQPERAVEPPQEALFWVPASPLGSSICLPQVNDRFPLCISFLQGAQMKFPSAGSLQEEGASSCVCEVFLQLQPGITFPQLSQNRNHGL